MAFQTFVPGVLTASEMNTYLMQQVVITCTSSTRPASPVEGMTIYETDTNITLQYSGTAWLVFHEPWTSYTPVLAAFNLTTGAGSTTFNAGTGTVTGAYMRFGQTVHVNFTFTAGTGWVNPAAGEGLHFTVPTASTSAANFSVGHGRFVDVSATETYGLTAFRRDDIVGGDRWQIFQNFDPYDPINATDTLPAAPATGDFIFIQLMYRTSAN